MKIIYAPDGKLPENTDFSSGFWKPLKILSHGAGVQTTALALMSCENVLEPGKFPEVPVYDAVIFCDLCMEADRVYRQLDFVDSICQKCGIPVYVIVTDLYSAFVERFGRGHISSLPFWTLSGEGKKGKMPRQCTVDYKINVVRQFTRRALLGYQPYKRTRPEDIGAHELHIGFSAEEQQRIFDSRYPLFVNQFPLMKMKKTRADNYQYTLERWGLKTSASACIACPYHRNYFYYQLSKSDPESYRRVVEIDRILEERQPMTTLKSKLYLSPSLKRIEDLEPEDYLDARGFACQGSYVWNGF